MIPRRRSGADGGFSLIELAVAGVIAAMLVAAIAGTLRAAIGTSRADRLRQEATAILVERVEEARSLGWDSLAMAALDPGAPLIDPGSGALLGAEAGLPGDEALLVCDGGGVVPKAVEAAGGETFTSWAYVTRLSADLRRVVVLVTWVADGVPGSFLSSTVVSDVSAGGAIVTGAVLFPDAAVVAMGGVSLTGGASTSTYPGTSHVASVHTNLNYSDATSHVDGDVRAGGAATVLAGNVFGTVEQNAGVVVVLPDPIIIEAWRSGLRTAAQGGQVLAGGRTFTDTTITGPLYVTGSIDFYGIVNIGGTGPVYATGAIRLREGAMVQASDAALTSDTLVEFRAGAEYHLGTATQGGVVSFGTSSSALVLLGGADGSWQGVAYAPYGGFTLSGAVPWRGALVAGGENGLGRVAVTGAGVVYPAGLLPVSPLLDGLRPEPPTDACN
jgi:type II secretory pathway pseudopilin PulG